MDSPSLLSMPRLRVSADEARQAPVQEGHLSALLMRHGSLEVRWLAQHPDEQSPHDRDELYVVVSGTGVFVRTEERIPFGDAGHLGVHGEERITVQPGDTLFVPAGTPHQFEVMSADFGAWMIFYGPEGGEQG